MTLKLTKDTVAQLLLPPGKTERIVGDGDIPGFGVRLRPHSSTYIFRYRYGMRAPRITIGKTSAIPVQQARNIASQLYAQVKLGRDPADERRTARQQQVVAQHSAPRWNLEHHIAQKALGFLERGQEPACYLYRHYHPNGDLLYVGVSLEPLRRQDSHLKTATWRDMITHIVIEPFATREEALAAEQRAIRKEFPKFNATHNRQCHPFQELMRRDPAPEIQ